MKFAICLHGLVGNIKDKSGYGDVGSDIVLKISHLHLLHYFIEKYNPDIFIHSWNTELRKNIKKMFRPKKMLVEEQKQFEVPEWIKGEIARKHNHYSKWYSCQESVRLMREYEQENNFKYDFVLIARFDIAWKSTININKLDNTKFYIGGWNRATSSKVKDFWFLGSSDNIYKFSKLYEKIEYYCKQNVLSKKFGISSHKMAGQLIRDLGFETVSLLMCTNDTNGDGSDYPLIRHYYFKADR